MNKEISDINGQIQIKENEKNTYQNHLFEVNKIQLTKKEMTFVKKSLEKIEEEISQLVSDKRITEEKKENLNEEITRLEQEKDNITNFFNLLYNFSFEFFGTFRDPEPKPENFPLYFKYKYPGVKGRSCGSWFGKRKDFCLYRFGLFLQKRYCKSCFRGHGNKERDNARVYKD